MHNVTRDGAVIGCSLSEKVRPLAMKVNSGIPGPLPPAVKFQQSPGLVACAHLTGGCGKRRKDVRVT
jgi:hypothetical protein